MKKYKSKGLILFRLGKEGIETQTFDKDYYINKYKNDGIDSKTSRLMFCMNHELDVYNLIEGEKFLRRVESYGIMDYDGHIAEVYVDGYKSNLGLATDNLTQGDFLVSRDVWLDLCDTYKIEVNWVNK